MYYTCAPTPMARLFLALSGGLPNKISADCLSLEYYWKIIVIISIGNLYYWYSADIFVTMLLYKTNILFNTVTGSSSKIRIQTCKIFEKQLGVRAFSSSYHKQ